jgi:hypothetical protein
LHACECKTPAFTTDLLHRASFTARSDSTRPVRPKKALTGAVAAHGQGGRAPDVNGLELLKASRWAAGSAVFSGMVLRFIAASGQNRAARQPEEGLSDRIRGCLKNPS